MKQDALTRLEQELLIDLLEVEEHFFQGRLKSGTIRSHALYRMASRRGKTLPAPVAGKHKAHHTFVGVFTRTLNRLVSKKLARKRSIKDDFEGLPYQWGYGRHARKDSDIFLTEEGKRLARELLAEKAGDKPTKPVTPAPRLRLLKGGGGKPPDRAADSDPPAPGPVTQQEPDPAAAAGGIEYIFRPSRSRMARKTEETGRFTLLMGPARITYVYTRKTHGNDS